MALVDSLDLNLSIIQHHRMNREPRPTLQFSGDTLKQADHLPTDLVADEKHSQRLATVVQRSSSNVEGQNGYLSRRNQQLRGLDRPRKRECLTAIHNFFLTRDDGTTAAEQFFGQKPRSMFAAILGALEGPPAPLSPPRWA